MTSIVDFCLIFLKICFYIETFYEADFLALQQQQSDRGGAVMHQPPPAGNMGGVSCPRTLCQRRTERELNQLINLHRLHHRRVLEQSDR